MAGAHGREPRLHHLPGRQAVPDRAQARRPARRCSSAPSRAAWGSASAPTAAASRWRRTTSSSASTMSCPRAQAAWRASTRCLRRTPPGSPAISTSMTSAFGADGRPVFVNTLFACLATVSDGYSFSPLWKPPFISRSPPRTAATSTAWRWRTARRATSRWSRDSDVADGWRDRRADGGVRHRRRRPASRCCAACRCRIRRACTTAGSGCSIPAPASSAFVDRDAEVRAGRLLPGLCARARLHRHPCVVGLSLARENRTFSGPGARRRRSPRAAPSRAAACRGRSTPDGDMIELGADRGRGARAVRRRRAARRPPPVRDRLQDRRDQARHLDRRDLTAGRADAAPPVTRGCRARSVEAQSEIASD